MLAGAAISTHLVDLGAEVIKVEPPSGDYVREMTWPIVNGVSLLHLHVNRGKQSVVIDLRTEAGREVFLDLVARADVVIEAMRPGGLARRGLDFERLREVNPRIVMCTISGYGDTGPYRDLPSHGIAYDAWAGIIRPAQTDDGFAYIPEHVSIGMNAGPLYGSLGILAALTNARSTGEGCHIEIAQADAAAAFDWLRIESARAYERPEGEVTGNQSDEYERRAPGTAGMEEGVRYQIYESSDGFILLMCSEQKFWRNLCQSIDRADLFERWPGKQYADHAQGNRELRSELRGVFRTRTTAAWVSASREHDFALAPVNDTATRARDPQFLARTRWMPRATLGADQLPNPIKIVDEPVAVPALAPSLGEHQRSLLETVLAYDDDRIRGLRDRGAFGSVDLRPEAG